MTQNGARPSREYGRHPSPLSGQAPVAYRVDAAMHTVQATGLDSVRDCMPTEPEIEQLPPGNHAVLPICQSGNRFVPLTNLRLCTPGAPNRRFVRHTPMLAETSARVAR